MRTKLILFLCVFSLLACKKEPEVGPQGPQGPAGSSSIPIGSFAGKIHTYDQFGDSMQTGQITTTVSIKSTGQSTTTKANGTYTLSNVPAGVHTVLFNASGFGEFQYQEIAFPGNGKLTLNGYLHQKPNFTITNAEIFSGFDISVSGTLSPISSFRNRGVAIIAGMTPTVDITIPSSYFTQTVFSISSGSSFFFTSIFINQDIHGKVFLKVYPYNGDVNTSQYLDVESEKYVYPAFGIPFPNELSVFR